MRLFTPPRATTAIAIYAQPFQNDITRRPGDHVHGYLTSLRGTLDLHKVTGEAIYLNQVIAAWQDVVDSGDMLITGGVPERWSPKKDRTEGCAEADWLRLNLALYGATGDPMVI